MTHKHTTNKFNNNVNENSGKITIDFFLTVAPTLYKQVVTLRERWWKMIKTEGRYAVQF